ncbi:uncharacterized protein EI97DRAFT_444269 [Westerdykella ornata]|uniref:Rhodopsin domain-containing protein n=1 Tax=Westerdykella ornata TaxID=318751 RepID=A0A6A6JCV6_WESOR|nr:uncharacterized protein EI97DRAFT_444269 [Westerdykella ornata]KAF2274262.1 hypothetical protein EI97DRAFT_444269 [Westerdykella ornata]
MATIAAGSPAAGLPNPALIPATISQDAVDTARKFVAVTIALNIIAALLFGGRIWTRTFPVFRMGPDDYLILLAYPLVLVDSILLLVSVPYGFGADLANMTMVDIEEQLKYVTVSQPIWAWSMCVIKCSVTAMLLRLENDKFWRRFLWGMIGVHILLAVYCTIALTTQCIPLSGSWDLLKLKPAKCWSAEAVRASSIASSAVNIASDIILALMPINFLRKVQRPMRERVIIGMLMGLGVFAATASIVKVRVAANWGIAKDMTNEGIKLSMWTILEEVVGLIAACIPCLRSLFQKVLVNFGLVTDSNKPSGRGYGQMYGDMGTSRTKGTRSDVMQGTKLKTLRSEDAHSEENILQPGTDAGKSGEIWCTTEVRMQEEVASSRLDLQAVKDQGNARSWSAASEHSHEDGGWPSSKPSRNDIV